MYFWVRFDLWWGGGGAQFYQDFPSLQFSLRRTELRTMGRRSSMLNATIIWTIFPLLLLTIVAEILIYRHRNMVFPYREAGLSLAMSFIYQGVNILTGKILVPLNTYFFNLSEYRFAMNSIFDWILLFFLLEFCYYWRHRASHEITWLWASHSVHHSPTTMTFSGAYRLSLTNLLSMAFVFFIPVYIFGFPPEAVSLMFSCNLLYQFWLHTDLIPKLGWFEKIFNTPSHHRVHHAINPLYLDKNHGGVLIVFDKMFGTFQEELSQESARYGLVGKENSLNPLKLWFQDWISIARHFRECRSLSDVLVNMFGAPGEFRSYMDKKKEERGARILEKAA
jgi:sterol desaturase/sphingolipid hydroxylase (fatty acid hydroxylase superfamily)